MLKPNIFQNFKSYVVNNRVLGTAASEAWSDGAKFCCGVTKLLQCSSTMAIKISQEVQAAILPVFLTSLETRVSSLETRVIPVKKEFVTCFVLGGKPSKGKTTCKGILLGKLIFPPITCVILQRLETLTCKNCCSFQL